MNTEKGTNVSKGMFCLFGDVDISAFFDVDSLYLDNCICKRAGRQTSGKYRHDLPKLQGAYQETVRLGLKYTTCKYLKREEREASLMSDYMMNIRTTHVSNMAWLTAIPYDGDYSSYRKASEACDRFWQAAALLPVGEYLGWQISIYADGGCRSFCFSSSGVNVTEADYNWIFETCASAVSGLPEDTPEEFFSNGRKIYMLSSLPGCVGKNGKGYQRQDCSYYDDYDDGTVNEDFADLLKMIDSAGGASLRIFAEAACDGPSGQGMILLSLPCEIPLRMKTLLSLTFGRAAVHELGETAIENAGRLPAACIIEGMTGLQQSLMRREAENRGESMKTDSLMLGDEDLESELYGLEEDDLELELCEAKEDITPLDELELSIRSYNCLRRAGIHSVEQLCSMSDDELAKVKNLAPKSLEEVRRARSEFSKMSGIALRTAPDYKAMLDELIGLADVKEQVKRIISYARMKKDMEASGAGAASVVLNMEFVGNPGTAKTTVARILAGVFHEIGLLSGREPVEVGRADLIAEYVGQTAIKVKSVFQRAKGRLLFIDEAYSLVEKWEGSYGDEAIDTIVQEMENHRSDMIVMFAGYPEEMEKLFSRNPGLRSRVPFTVRFQDYSVEEMEQITEQEAKKKGFAIQPKAKDKVLDICRTARACANVGNGRFCRNLVENAILSYASRVYGDEVNEDTAKDFVLVEEDFSISELSEPPRTSNPIGFRV